MKVTSFKFDEATMQTLDELKARTHAASRKEVIRKALHLMDMVTRAHAENQRLVIKGSGQEPERELFLI